MGLGAAVRSRQKWVAHAREGPGSNPYRLPTYDRLSRIAVQFP